ncbi:ATP-binding protein [Desulfobaculum senezii]
MRSPISLVTSKAIGAVENVVPDEIKVLLDIDTPRNTALNTGEPTSFPRLNSYILFPNESGAVVGIVTWLGVERSSFPKRQGLKDFGLIDLPFPLRKMALCPLGTLKQNGDGWQFERGVHVFPSIGDAAILPTKDQTKAIVSGGDTVGKIKLGTCPSAHSAPIYVDPNRLYGRHLAILGNTGSGKSCSVAGTIKATMKCIKKNLKNSKKNPNARFIILDPNGEYSKCFGELGVGYSVFKIPPLSKEDKDEKNISSFSLPAWMWDSAEWAAISRASAGVQRPVLQTTLRLLRSARQDKNMHPVTRTYIQSKCMLIRLMPFLKNGAIDFKDKENVWQALNNFKNDIAYYKELLGGMPDASNYSDDVQAIDKTYNELEYQVQCRVNANNPNFVKYDSYSAQDIEDFVVCIEGLMKSLNTREVEALVNEDLPIQFDITTLVHSITSVAQSEGSQTAQYISSMVLRITALLNDARLKDVINPSEVLTLPQWLNKILGDGGEDCNAITVIDLSLVSSDVLHLLITICARLIFEALQRYHKSNEKPFPTVLVLEEAHTFVTKGASLTTDTLTPADMCRQAFEKISREGRKFGLGLVLSSQRPSELSETVISQCNSFFLHRITNDRDQELVRRLVPDTARGILKELPSLPTKQFVALGLCTNLPVLIQMEDLKDCERPQSDDPDFWDVWTRNCERSADWNEVVDEWTNQQPEEQKDKKGGQQLISHYKNTR